MIQLAIADDHPIIREGLHSLFQCFSDISVNFTANDGLNCISQMEAFPNTDILLTDIDMPGMDGIMLTSVIKEKFTHLKVIGLSLYNNESVIKKMIKAGAASFLCKTAEPEEIINTIRAVQSNQRATNQYVQDSYFEDTEPDTMKLMKKTDLNDISKKEKEFIHLNASDLSYKEIASVMNVSPRTVDNYRDSLYRKLNVKSRVGLVLSALKKGFIGQEFEYK